MFIAIDDLRNWVGYNSDYGGLVHTPNIDALAAESTRYLNAYTAVPQCVGSRTTVMLGLSPATHGITFSSWGNDPTYLAVYNNPLLTSLPEVLSEHGYYSAVTGKVFNSPLPGRWDESGPSPAPVYCQFCPGPHNTFLDPGVLPDNEEHADQVVANWATNFINNYAGSAPFFLAVGFYQPHIPWRVPQWAYDLYPLAEVAPVVPYPGDLDDEPDSAAQLVSGEYLGHTLHEWVEINDVAAEYTRAYLASISHTDVMLGQILAALAASPFAATTDIVLWSDHGFHLGDKFHWGKNTFWDPAVKVPLLVSSPGNPSYPVADIAAPVSLLDLAPTVLDLAGLDVHPQFEGVPLRDGSNASPVEIYFNKGKATITPGDRKTIDYNLQSPPGAIDKAAYLLSDTPEADNLLYIDGC